MKEMCKNFIGDTGASPAMPQGRMQAQDCNACVIEKIGLAQAFVPSQPFEQPMDREQSLVCGTVFSALAMPYCSGWQLYQNAKEE